MPWLQLHFTSTREQSAALETLLQAQGAASITLQDAQDEPQFVIEPGDLPLWTHMTISALFSVETDLNALLANLKDNFDGPLPNYTIETLEDQQWERLWMEHFKPMPMGQRLWICPSWENAPDPEAINLILDPGLAFGTGTHPTTALCLRWLDAQALEGQLAQKRIIDYGCGSGILAIAALLLGSGNVDAIDHDAQAIIATQDNATTNHISSSQLACYLPEQTPPDLNADIILANILAKPLLHLVDVFLPFCHTGTLLILSGILHSQADEIVECYQAHFKILHIEEQDGWVRIDCEKK